MENIFDELDRIVSGRDDSTFAKELEKLISGNINTDLWRDGEFRKKLDDAEAGTVIKVRTDNNWHMQFEVYKKGEDGKWSKQLLTEGYETSKPSYATPSDIWNSLHSGKAI